MCLVYISMAHLRLYTRHTHTHSKENTEIIPDLSTQVSLSISGKFIDRLPWMAHMSCVCVCLFVYDG